VRDGHANHHVVAGAKLGDRRQPFSGVRMSTGEVLHDLIDNVWVALDFGMTLRLQAADVIFVVACQADGWSGLEIVKFGSVILGEEVYVHVCVVIAADGVDDRAVGALVIVECAENDDWMFVDVAHNLEAILGKLVHTYRIANNSNVMSSNIPLAEQMRPHTLDDVIGQLHLLGDDGILKQIVKSKRPVSLILWGPPGSGKTTLARIIANEVNADFVEISAVTAGMADVRKVVERAKTNQNLGQQTVLFVDEIHRFNKAQQDAFLPHVESGLITLIGATTENPSFEVITPLLSRTRVLVLEPHTKDDIVAIVKHALKTMKATKRVAPAAIDYLAELSGGDARVALGNLELALELSDGKVTIETVKTAAQKRLPGYDKKGDMHYNVISAFIKSMRGSNVDATLYYLARMLQAGEDPKFIARRMVIFASEDIGLAGNGGLNLAVSTFLAVERIGMPECQYNLFHCATALAKAEKSRQVADAMSRALRLAADYPESPVPLHLRNAPTKLMKDLGYNKDYKWEADFKHEAGFLPDELKDKRIF
jgi:putative ATPase